MVGIGICASNLPSNLRESVDKRSEAIALAHYPNKLIIGMVVQYCEAKRFWVGRLTVRLIGRLDVA